MNIEFVNKNTVKISASMPWDGRRPPQSGRVFIKTSDVIEAFNTQHAGYRVKGVTGPAEICNFRRESDSKGEWLLTVVKLRPKTTQPRASVDPPVKAKTTFRPLKKTTKKGA